MDILGPQQLKNRILATITEFATTATVVLKAMPQKTVLQEEAAARHVQMAQRVLHLQPHASQDMEVLAARHVQAESRTRTAGGDPLTLAMQGMLQRKLGKMMDAARHVQVENRTGTAGVALGHHRVGTFAMQGILQRMLGKRMDAARRAPAGTLGMHIL